MTALSNSSLSKVASNGSQQNMLVIYLDLRVIKMSSYVELNKAKAKEMAESTIARLYHRQDSFMSPLDEIDLTFGSQEEACENVLRACRHAETTVCVSLRDLRKIS